MVPPQAERLETTELDRQETWSAEGHPVLIRYPTALVRSLTADAVKAFCVIPAGGIEIGGLLYGTRDDDGGIRLAEYRRFDCEYKYGPSFVLSEADGERLADLIRAGQEDASLSALELVGWFHSHTRSGVFLSDADLRLYNHFFPEPWQVALVLRPQALRPSHAGFFFREAGGSIRADASYREFEIGGRPRQRRETDVFVMPPPSPAQSPVAEPAPVDEAPAAPVPHEPPTVPEPPVPVAAAAPDEVVPVAETPTVEPVPVPSAEPDEPAAIAAEPAEAAPADVHLPVRWWIWLGGVAAVLLACIAALWIIRGPSTAPEISLRMRESNGFVMVEWDPQNKIVAGSTTGRLEVRDGDGATQAYDLEKADLNAGRVLCLAQSKRVQVRMKLFGGSRSPREFVAMFEVPTRQPAAAPPAQGSTSVAVTAAPEAPTPPAAQPPKPEPAKVAPAIVEPNNSDPGRTEVAAQPAPEPRAATPVAELRLPPRPEARAPELAAPPPSFAVNPTSVAPPISGPAVTAAPPPPAKKEPPRIRAPKSGRAIWTGELRPGETLILENGRVTKGVISGSLPQAPARIRANAAELGEGSMAIYTDDPALRERAGTFESPSARNGWNLTTYKFEPKRSRDLSVIESPAASNGWRKLAVRAVSRKLTMIVLDWEELPQTADK